MRKIVQLERLYEGDRSDKSELVVLCDDGSIWRGGYRGAVHDSEWAFKWTRLPGVPQDESLEKSP
jgi:hypothetical protein